MTSKDAGNLYLTSNTTDKSFLQGTLAGGITGGFETIITYPLDYLKTHMQLKKLTKGKPCQGMVHSIKHTMCRHGVIGFYRGLAINLCGGIPITAVRFGTYECLRTYLHNEHKQFGEHAKWLCGGGTGVVEGILVVTPIELIRVRYINDQHNFPRKYKGLMHGVSTIIKEESLVGLYKGLVATTIKQSSNQAIRFGVIEILRDHYKNEKGEIIEPVPKWKICLVGGFGGAISVVANNPTDVVKTRMQGMDGGKYKTSRECVKDIFKKEGITGFYRGTVPRLSGTTLNVAITFVFYDIVNDFLKVVW